ncbi:MAG TPA: hypothetical protein VFH63_06430 [candidate division Zixibacteria bacterium]|nr:hypothetical protein [candidate division Zixibacteria bacterium]
MLRRLTASLMALALTLPVLATSAGPAKAREPVVPMPGELVLTDAERRLVRETMTPNERAVVGPLLEASDRLLLRYTRRLYRVVPVPGGGNRPELLAADRQVPGSALVLPEEALASTATKAGTDLYISFTVVRTRSTPPYEWQVFPYAEWRGWDGINRDNSSADALAVAWAGDAYVHSQKGMGQLTDTWLCGKGPIDIWASDGTPNTGTAFSFHETGYLWGCRAWWAAADIRIREDTWQSRTDNLVYKYYHSFGGLEYSFSFSKSPGVSITPTREQWALTVFETYRH